MHAKTRRREVRVTVYNSLHALPECRSSEVQKQPQGLLQQAQICQQLLAVHRGKLLDSRLGYWIRPGKHAMSPDDWKIYMDFADKWLK